jgi:sugar lactone lactonase YvrE
MKIRLTALLLLSSLTTLVSTTAAQAALLIGNTRGNSITLFDETTGSVWGELIGPASGLSSPDDITIGPDGNLYISNGGDSGLNLFAPNYPQNSAVLRFSPTGQLLGVAATGNGLIRPYGNAFGPDGNLYVSSFRTNQILRFAPAGAFIDVFASDNANGAGSLNGLNGPNDLLFGPDGSLYVTTQGSANNSAGDLVFPFESQVLRYRPEQVAGLVPTTTPSVFAPQPTPLADSFNFVSFLGLALAPDRQSIYTSDFANGIRQYDLAGTLLNVLATNYTGTSPSNNFIGAIAFGSGSNAHNLYATGFDFANNNIGSVLSFTNAQGSATQFSGSLVTDAQFQRPIGISVAPAEAVPEPATIAGVLLAAGGLGRWRRRAQR